MFLASTAPEFSQAPEERHVSSLTDHFFITGEIFQHCMRGFANLPGKA